MAVPTVGTKGKNYVQTKIKSSCIVKWCCKIKSLCRVWTNDFINITGDVLSSPENRGKTHGCTWPSFGKTPHIRMSPQANSMAWDRCSFLLGCQPGWENGMMVEGKHSWGSMIMENPTIIYDCTKCHIVTTLARYFNKCLLACVMQLDSGM